MQSQASKPKKKIVAVKTTARKSAPAVAAAAAPALVDNAKIRTLGKRMPKASEVLVHTLLETIATRGLKDGDRLPQESDMIAQYGVARATVREALRILELNGLVRLRSGPGGGPTVRAATPADLGRIIGLYLQAENITLAELFLARSLIEPALARDAAQQRQPAFVKRAQDLLERGRTVDIADDAAYVQITREFHEIMVSGTRNRVFTLIALALMSMFIGRLDRAIHPPQKRRHILDEHEAILQAIIDGDAASAERLMQLHMGAVQKSIAARYPDANRELIRWA